MRKKLLFCFFIILSICLISFNVKAAETNIFSMTNATGAKDEEVTVIINLDKELEFASADLIVEYDSSKLEYVRDDKLDIFNKSAMSIVKNNSDTGKIAIGYVSNPNPTDLLKSPGQMLSITFKIKSDDSETIKISLKCTSLKNDEGTDIEVSDTQSEIVVKQKDIDTDSDEEKDSDKGSSTDSGNDDNKGSDKNSDTDSDEENKTDYETDNKNSGSNGISNNTMGKNTGSITVKEPDKANSQISLPKTGKQSNIIIVLSVLIIMVSYYSYKRYKDLKNI